MAAAIMFHQPQLPWTIPFAEQRRYWRILLTTFCVIALFSVGIPLIDLPEKPRNQVEELPPRLARLIEQKKAPPPPPPKPVEEKKEEPKPEEKPKEEPKEEPKEDKKEEPKEIERQPEETTQPAAIEAAREKVKKVGVLALSDSLSDLRDTETLSSLKQEVLTSGGETSVVTAKVGAGARAVNTTTTTGSGGISTDQVRRETSGVEIDSRDTSKIASATATKAAAETQAKTKKKAATGGLRNEEEIQRTIERNKGAFYRIYNRALRKNPALEGKVVFAITIEENGSVSEVKVVASDLDDKALEAKLVARIRLIDFGAQDVRVTTVRIPLDFFPA